ncbi:hypothetical protein AB0E25_02770 [Streptomyces bobili]|uniref:hypothetical protein n=1 Tax=Streptomyces bobili TaxID=67280 RepID=UPI0033C78E50
MGRGAVSADEAVLKDYFAQAFAERRNNYKEMLARLDRALDEGNAKNSSNGSPCRSVSNCSAQERPANPTNRDHPSLPTTK